MKHSQHTVITQGVWAPGPKGEKLRRDGIPSLDGGLRGRRLWRSPVPLPTAMFSSHPKAPIHHWKPFSNDWRKSCSLRWNNEFFVAMENISENEGYSRNLSGYGNSIEHSQREMRSISFSVLLILFSMSWKRRPVRLTGTPSLLPPAPLQSPL